MAVYRINYQGHILTAEEIFNFGVHVQAASGQAANILTAAQTAGTLLWNGPPTPGSSITQLVPIATGIDTVVVNEIDSSGRNVDQATGALLLPGTSVAESLPPQCSVAVSTRTATPTRAGRGRFFLPPFAITQVASGLLIAAARSSAANAARAFVNSLNGAGFTVGVWGRGFTTVRPVTAIDVGNVFDTQRRRRDRITEVRVRFPIP